MAVFVYIACSLDGFIAKTDGDLDWLTTIPNEGNDDYGFSSFLGNIDGIVMGRNTFETVLGFREWPYDKPVFILSDSMDEIPGVAKGRAEIVRGDVRAIVAGLRDRGIGNIYVDGGRTIQSFLKADLVDEMLLTTVSKIIGGGIPLFDAIGCERLFRVERTEVLNAYLTRCHYVRERA